MVVQRVPENISFPVEEEKVLQLWKEWDVFQTSLKHSKGRPRFSFYDGPPFATGLPHYGHILAGTIKDIVTRFAHQNGFHVERRFGWDTHGLPIEYEIDKALGIKTPQQVAEMGIAKYNEECRKIVMRYAKDWEDIVGRIGRWIDFKNDYKTMYPWFMESVWWVFKQLFLKGLVYRGSKVMPFSTACHTPLSNFESGQNYKEVVDPAVMVSFPLEEDPQVSLVAWTTTPWTLPSNLTLCVNPNLLYAKVEDKASKKIFILMQSRLVSLYKSEAEYALIDTFPGSRLLGKAYEPLFPYFAKCLTMLCPEQMKERGAFRVLNDEYVTEESGTGVVHQAPYFGEDDYRVCLSAGVITKDMEIICPVDDSGCFSSEVPDFSGMHVKDADKKITQHLKSMGRLVHVGTVKHSYPFCWRSDTPLIYKAVPSWFIRVQDHSEDLLKATANTYWVPDFVKEKRFGNWLKEARDWAVSRNRYWGTPIPLWVSEDFEEVVCIGSISELEALTGQKISDLHREFVDGLTIPSKRPGQPPLRRVTEVFDCWFESGSMPYAQVHYPFERKKEFDESFPADFIAEGLDQTRGWFYTLLVIGTLIHGRAPFKNLIVNGMVLAADGMKMSKSKKNYPDPMEIVHKYGADALRLYLINSPVVRAESLKFKEEGVRDILKDVFLPWFNAFRFLMQNLERLEKNLHVLTSGMISLSLRMSSAPADRSEEGELFVFDERQVHLSTNTMDRWIMSFTQSLLEFFHAEMEAYRLYTVVPKLVKFVDNLTNWYVRMNRNRLKGKTDIHDNHNALLTLFGVIFSLVRMMAPFTPFLAETMYQTLRHCWTLEGRKEEDIRSVHYLMLPKPRFELIDIDVERAVSRMQSIIDLGRVVRDRNTIPLKYPLPELVVIHMEKEFLEDISSLKSYVQEELNVKEITTSSDKGKYGVCLRAEPDFRVLGNRLKGDLKKVMAKIKALSDEDLHKFLVDGQLEVEGHVLETDALRIMYAFEGSKAEELKARYSAHWDSQVLILVDITPDQGMQDEGTAREVINRIQKLRKKAKLVPTDPISVFYEVKPKGSELDRVVEEHREALIASSIKAPVLPLSEFSGDVLIQETQDLKGSSLHLVLRRNAAGSATSCNGCRFLNLVWLCGSDVKKGTILLENPARRAGFADKADFENSVRRLCEYFGTIPIEFYDLSCGSPSLVQDLFSRRLDFKSKTLLVVPRGRNINGFSFPVSDAPFSKFIEVSDNGDQAMILLENPVGNPVHASHVVKYAKQFLPSVDPSKLGLTKL
ncbi:unnamed protein product [Notodromas monacha]|uniref:Isoleucine--tRNA ligase, cytoplasmic n=1 Tax=Notodromas monacha TaxID=399045 RepID=A0A7R9G9G2_9CRUS|nr:unnamed protein product [Notodromas monacha]CAG0912846.1 unnamed protein product [Notodromas monacha]